MKCIKYRVIVKKTGKVHYENIAWINKETNTQDWIRKNFNLRLVDVMVIK